ncbi:molybdopterin-guanine dinucleotide biosynthesis protein B [Virgibacillus sp. 179-BFC.A HS]|uniref:Molybdopterin-guanine dinucleotide biosynthesis protein B n=1 Tax=Tigheibacillus jepli TaxID=3035914 RepID=A0ABU5CIL6_9BACI|nr:molybdopterin-guanine dinucleotide biosynthesis protein B [Virgibacillus sp. 179-BFC.A HS]MDY0406189.1 molybdopterin-guanine dinucleotide biosynthesis protein B [Virgibacillus sp. 179-BFC.A HS]
MNKKPPIPVVQIAGYKNSGKTTLMCKLITHYAKQNIRVASLKHHGHAGGFQVAENADSTLHMRAGANLAGVQAASEFQLSIQSGQQLSWEKMMAVYALFDVELLLVEGYKQLGFPKIVLLKEEQDKELLRLSNIIAVGSNNKALLQDIEYDTFLLQSAEAVPKLAQLCLERGTNG